MVDVVDASSVADATAGFAFAAWPVIFWPLLVFSDGCSAVGFRAVVAPFVASWLAADVEAVASVRPLSVLSLDERA